MGQRRSLSAQGFTLLELLVTLFVIALAAGLVGPAVSRSTETLRGRSDIARFSAILRHARDQAIATRRGHTVLIEPDARRATILAGEEVRLTRALPDELRVESQSLHAMTVRFEPNGVSSGGDFRLSAGRTRYRVTVDPVTGRVRVERGE